MKVSREQAAKNRAHVVDVAGGQFRAHGFDGIGIADLMRAAGLTHGGFYANFASKDDLAAEAVTKAFADTLSRLASATAGAPDHLAALVDVYLSKSHRGEVADGCVLAALAPDAARGPPAVRQAFEQGVEGYLARLTPILGDEAEEDRRRHAMVVLSTLVGALVLSRTVVSEALSDDLLETAAEALKKKA